MKKYRIKNIEVKIQARATLNYLYQLSLYDDNLLVINKDLWINSLEHYTYEFDAEKLKQWLFDMGVIVNQKQLNTIELAIEDYFNSLRTKAN